MNPIIEVRRVVSEDGKTETITIEAEGSKVESTASVGKLSMFVRLMNGKEPVGSIQLPVVRDV